MSTGPTTASGPAPDAGVATVWAAAGVAVVMTALLIALHLAAAVIGRHRAEAAADLAALAAAAVAVQGTNTACGRAREIAEANDTRLVHCGLVGWDAAVEVETGIAIALPGLATARGRAIAGPDPVAPEPEVCVAGRPRKQRSKKKTAAATGALIRTFLWTAPMYSALLCARCRRPCRNF